MVCILIVKKITAKEEEQEEVWVEDAEWIKTKTEAEAWDTFKAEEKEEVWVKVAVKTNVRAMV